MGEYYRAEDAEQLYDVFVNLPNEFVLQKDRVEISVIFAVIGGILGIIAVALSLWWYRYP